MTIYEWADRLGMDPHKGRNPEDFWTVCPCHADTKPSLHVYVGKKTGEIVMKCFVCGATGGEVCKALGLPIGEVMCDALSGEKTKQADWKAKGRGTAGGKTAKRSKPFEKGNPLRVGDREFTITNVYEYQDREGRVVLRKARAELHDDQGVRMDKSFLIQHAGTDGKWYSGGGIYTNLLYHQPDVLAMKGKPGRTIIAEGEKDVDNLRLLGLNATCGMHGGGIDKGGDSLLGKWNDDHSSCFDGLDDVVVIADNDAAGEGIAQWICKRIKDRVKSLRLLRIVEHWPQLAEHGDFTDWANELIKAGKRRSEIRVALESMIDETPEWTPGNIRHFEKKVEDKKESKTVRADGFDGGDSGGGRKEYEPYFDSGVYCIKNGRLARWFGQDAKTLCDFVPEPKEIVQRDDGFGVTTEYVIGGKKPDGTRLCDARIRNNKDLKSGGWMMDNWDCYGNVNPTVKNAERYIMDAINTAGQMRYARKNVFVHTGIREVDGRPVYLHCGGAIGAAGVSVELENKMAKYRLDDEGHSRMDAAAMELILLDSMPSRLIYPLLAQAYLAPVYSVLEGLQQPPSYVVFVVGASNAGKSTVTSYVQAHFGDFYNRQFPANFNDTANNVREKMFLAKDALMVIDDYRKGDGRPHNPMDMVADNVISAVADRAERGRQTADKKMEADRPCRCTCIMTGEDIPRVSTSRLMRIYRIDVEPGEIYKDVRELDVYRQTAKAGLYRSCMRYYISDLLGRWERVEDEISDLIDDMQNLVYGRLTRKEGRFVECATHLLVGVSLLLAHLERCGVIDEADRRRRLEKAAQDVVANIDDQGRSVDETKPEMIWLNTLRSLIATRSVTLGDKGDITNGFRAGEIGFKDGGVICLSPPKCDELIGENLRKSGMALGASRQSILRALARGGFIRYKAKAGGAGIGETTIVTRYGQAQERMIHLYAWALERDTPPTPEEQGFVPTDGEQLPMEFKEK